MMEQNGRMGFGTNPILPIPPFPWYNRHVHIRRLDDPNLASRASDLRREIDRG